MQSFKFLRYALHGDLVEDRRRERGERRREKIMPILMATSPSAQRRSDQQGTVKGRAQSSSNCLVNPLGQLQCGDPPDISIAGVVKMSDLVKLELMTVKYRCPEG